MKRNIISPIIFLAITLLMAACSMRQSADEPEDTIWGNDPTNAETVYRLPATGTADSTFSLVVYRNSDGSVTKSIVCNANDMTDHYALYSPAGNLKLLVAGPCLAGDVYGIKIDYDKSGAVNCISILKTLGDITGDEAREGLSMKNAHDAFISWMQQPDNIDRSISVERDSTGAVTAVGNVKTRNDYKASLYIKEWGPFWTSDLDGGRFGIFTLQEYQGDKSGSYVNYLYEEDKLIAELAYWRGTLIKVRTYNRYGTMVEQYNDRDIDINATTFADFDREEKWWADK